MEKVKEVKVTDYDVIHDFYCDGCNKHLGTSEEYDDGYYETFGDFELSFFMPHIIPNLNGTGNWYKVKKCFCNECAKSFKLKVISELEKLGFKEE